MCNEEHMKANFFIGSIVINIVIIMCGSRWVLEVWGEHTVNYMVI